MWGIHSIMFPLSSLIFLKSKGYSSFFNNILISVDIYNKCTLSIIVHYFYFFTKNKKSILKECLMFKWCLEMDSNHRPLGYEPSALAN